MRHARTAILLLTLLLLTLPVPVAAHEYHSPRATGADAHASTDAIPWFTSLAGGALVLAGLTRLAHRCGRLSWGGTGAVLTIAALGGAHVLATAQSTNVSRAANRMQSSFAPFAPGVTTRHDNEFFYIESDGMPDHRMMVGIRAWQQQVPLPQDYRGNNAWRVPLFPVPAKAPLSASANFFRGAIAIAANGVPIFNPIKNDGRTDTFLAGELDEFGGHGGRADDYHYHLAPLHLEAKIGRTTPVAWALDGYPVFGLHEPDGSAPTGLDAFNGHDTVVGYHYHASKTYPYLNGGFHGEVVEREGQVEPQPVATPVRPAGDPLRGAVITGFERDGTDAFRLTYSFRGATQTIRYTVGRDGRFVFTFTDGDGRVTAATYVRRERRRLPQ